MDAAAVTSDFLDAERHNSPPMKSTDWLAIYGATLSTIVFIWNIRQSRPKLRLDVIPGFKNTQSGYGVFVVARNQSSRPIHLATISPLIDFSSPSTREKLQFIFKYRRWPADLGWTHSSFEYYELSHGCPIVIEPGSSHEIFIPNEKVEQVLERGSARLFKVSAQDKLWNNYYSNALNYPKAKTRT